MAKAELTSAEHFNFPRNPKRRTRRNVVSFFLERATRLELATRHPANGSPPFAGTLPHLLIESRLRRGVEAASSPSNEKTGRPTLGVLFQMERATRLELASRHPANGSPPFAGTLPHLLIESRLRRGVEAASSPSNEKTGRPTLGVLFQMERATRLELATSTLARWRSTR